MVVEDYLLAIDQLDARLGELDAQLAAVASTEPYREPVGWLRCFRGIDTLTAMLLLAELHDIKRFPTARALMAYLGLVNVTGTEDDDAEHEGDVGEDDADHEHEGDADHDHEGAERGRNRRSFGEVQIRVPVSVVDALLSGTGETFDVRAAIQELASLRGEMVQVIQPDTRIRVWIDESPTQ